MHSYRGHLFLVTPEEGVIIYRLGHFDAPIGYMNLGRVLSIDYNKKGTMVCLSQQRRVTSIGLFRVQDI